MMGIWDGKLSTEEENGDQRQKRALPNPLVPSAFCHSGLLLSALNRIDFGKIIQ